MLTLVVGNGCWWVGELPFSSRSNRRQHKRARKRQGDGSVPQPSTLPTLPLYSHTMSGRQGKQFNPACTVPLSLTRGLRL